MTLKLRRKLQITTQRITAEPLTSRGGRMFCRTAVMCAAALSAAWAAAETRFVQPVAYQQNSVETASVPGNVPVVRMDAVSADSDSYSVQPVAYNAPAVRNSESVNASSPSSASASAASLKWVPVNSPEARDMHSAQNARRASSNHSVSAVRPASASVSRQERSFVTPIPAVMPRCPRVRTVANEEESVLPLESSLDSLDAPATGSAETVPAAENENDSAGLSLDGDTPMVPAVTPENEGLESLLPEDTSDAQKPGAIGNNDGNMLNQGGLTQDTNASENGTVEEDAVENQLPEVNGKDASNGNDALLKNKPRDPSESITMRQMDADDYDIPCESTEPMHRITEITNDISLHDTKIVPKSCPLAADTDLFPAREFAGTNVTWTASNLCHNPLYFEQPALERYGHSIGPLQPVLSGAEFLITIPAMPMLMAIDPPNECQYSLGYYRPGSCAPFKWSPIPYSTRGAIVEGGVATALVFLIP